MLKNIIRDSFIYIPSKFLPAISRIIGISVFTRLLSTSEYGLYTLFLNIIGLAAIVYAWLNSASFRYYEKFNKEEKLDAFNSTLITSYLILSIGIIITGIISYIFLRRLISTMAPIYWLCLGILLLQNLFQLFTTIQRASFQPVKYSLYSILEAWGQLALAILGIYIFVPQIKGVFIGYCLTYFLLVLILSVDFFRHFRVSINSFSVVTLKIFASYGFPLIGLSLSVWLLSVSDRYVIQFFRGLNGVGIYTAGYQLASNIMTFPTSILMLSAFPFIIRAYEKEPLEYCQRLLTRLVALHIILFLPLITLLIVLSKPIVKLLLGNEFYQSSEIIPIVGMAHFIVGLSLYFEKAYQLKGNTQKLFIFHLSSSGLNLMLNFIFIPFWGIKGAALTTLISYVTYTISMAIYGRKLLSWAFPYNTTIKSILGCVISGLILFAMVNVTTRYHIMFVFSMLVFALTYFLILFLIREKTVIDIINHIKMTKNAH